MELLRLIAEISPQSVSELAVRSGRAQANVSRALHRLATHGLIRLERDGKQVRPVLVTREIHVDLVHSTYQAVRILEVA
jgi:predicted transcriptional regulator